MDRSGEFVESIPAPTGLWTKLSQASLFAECSTLEPVPVREYPVDLFMFLRAMLTQIKLGLD